MSQKHIATYLNDHLAGSVWAMELLAFLHEAHDHLKQPTTFLRNEIPADRLELERVMSELGVEQSPPRKVMAWMSEKAMHVKLWINDAAGGNLRTLEGLEIVSLGIEGKKGLWRALAAAATTNSRLKLANYDQLVRRAEEQREVAESLRLDAARMALG